MILIHLRQAGKKANGIYLRAGHVEFMPWNEVVEFYNLKTEEHDTINYDPETKLFSYNNETFEFCNCMGVPAPNLPSTDESDFQTALKYLELCFEQATVLSSNENIYDQSDNSASVEEVQAFISQQKQKWGLDVIANTDQKTD